MSQVLDVLQLSERVKGNVDKIKQIGKGRFFTLVYENPETRKALESLKLKKISMYSCQLAEYENMSKVINYRETTGICPCNPATLNEIPTEVFGVFFNLKTNKVKLRVPLNGCKATGTYFLKDSEVITQEEYNTCITAAGLVIAKPYPSKTQVEYRSFDLDKVLRIV